MYEIRNTCISINIVDNLKNLQADVMALKPVKYWSYWQVEILTQLFKRKKKCTWLNWLQWVQYPNSPGGVSRAGDNLVVIQEATAGQVTWEERKKLNQKL